MGKLVAIGALMFGFSGVHAPMTRAEAIRAIADSPIYSGPTTGAQCVPDRQGMACTLRASACFDDSVFGHSLVVATTILQVSRWDGRYHVRTAAPERFDIYAC